MIYGCLNDEIHFVNLRDFVPSWQTAAFTTKTRGHKAARRTCLI